MKQIFLIAFLFISVFVKAQTTIQIIDGPSASTLGIEWPAALMSKVRSEVTIIFPEGSLNILSNDHKGFLRRSAVDIVTGNDTVNYPLNNNSIALEVEPGNGNFIVQSGGEELKHEQGVIPLWTSILPPLIAVIMALIFKEVLVSLLMGIFIGTAVMGFYAEGLVGIFTGFLRVIDTFVLNALNDGGHLSVIVFSMLIGGIVAVISRNGGMQGVVDHISKFANSPKSGQMATYLLGVVIFFDDYANTLVVGNTMRPVTDRLRISREKLAYLVDSTAAPVAAIAFVTTWIGAELGYISSGIEKINASGQVVNESSYGIFVSSLAYSFYPVFTLAFMLILIRRNRDFGPMFHAEQRARLSGRVSSSAAIALDSDENQLTDEMEEFTPVSNAKKTAWNAILPVGVIIFGTLIGLYSTGVSNTNPDDLNGKSFFLQLSTIIGNADSYKSLLWSSMCGLLVAVLMTVAQRTMSLIQTMETAVKGFKTMLNAILILVLAWSLERTTHHLHTADFLTQLLGSDFSPVLIPAITFILAAIVAFSTGTSWGTMAILYPLMLPAAFTVCQNAGYDYETTMMIFYNTVSSVLAGAVLGDHCSPISDTTILSSLASSCNHLDHVKTQMPYALTVGAVSLLAGTFPAAMGVSSWILIPAGIIILYFIISYFGRKVDPAGGTRAEEA